jgi:ABC-type nitrate/sulfonate/bicarbonate transport system substrate-binding protein
VGDNRSRLAALQNNRVQAVNLSGVTLATALRSGFKTLIDFSKLPITIYISGIISTRSYISKNHDTTIKFLKGWLEGVYMFRADREVAMKVMRKHTRVQDGELIERVYNHYRELNNPMAKPSISVIQSMLHILSVMGRPTTGRPPEGFIDTTFFQILETTGFLDQMESRYPKFRD